MLPLALHISAKGCLPFWHQVGLMCIAYAMHLQQCSGCHCNGSAICHTCATAYVSASWPHSSPCMWSCTLLTELFRLTCCFHHLCRLLHSQWSSLICDHIVLSTQPVGVQLAFTPRLFPTGPQSAMAAIAKYLAAAWTHVLAAVCASLSDDSAAAPPSSQHGTVSAAERRNLDASAGRNSSLQGRSAAGAEGQLLPELSADAVEVLVDACHLAISHATATLPPSPQRQAGCTAC